MLSLAIIHYGRNLAIEIYFYLTIVQYIGNILFLKYMSQSCHSQN